MHGYGRSTDLLFQIYLDCSAAGPRDLLTIVQMLNNYYANCQALVNNNVYIKQLY